MAALSGTVVRTTFPRRDAFDPKIPHEPLHGAACNVDLISIHLPPDFIGPVDTAILVQTREISGISTASRFFRAQRLSGSRTSAT